MEFSKARDGSVSLILPLSSIHMSGLLRYAEYLFLDPKLGSSENAQIQRTFISDRHSFPWIAAKIDGNDHSFLLGFSCLSAQSYIESH